MRLFTLLACILIFAPHGITQGGDECSSATAISGTGAFDWVGGVATVSPEPGGACSTVPRTDLDEDLWFVWTATADGDYTFDTCLSVEEDDTALIVYEDCIQAQAGICLASGDDDCGAVSFLSEATLTGVTNGESYLIRVSDWSNGGAGDPDPLDAGTLKVTQDVTCTSAPANDECSAATPIAGTGLFAFDNTCATDSGVNAGAACTGSFGDNPELIPSDVWFVWTAPADGCFEISTCNLSPVVDTKMAVYSSDDCVAAMMIACNDDFGPPVCRESAKLTLANATAGESYLIQVGVWAGETTPYTQGQGMLSINSAPAGFANYCVTGTHGALMGVGANASLSITDNNFSVTASPLPDTFGLFFFAPDQIQIPFGGGVRCTGGGVFRLGPAIAPTSPGFTERTIDFTTMPGIEITPGSCWNFQYWFRDPPEFDLSNGLTVVFDL